LKTLQKFLLLAFLKILSSVRVTFLFIKIQKSI
jgi:hypothetical protein